jgi:uridine phosphorylase
MDALLEHNLLDLIDETSVSTVAERFPIYRFKGTDIGIVKTSIGAPMAAGMIEEIGYVFSCTRFVLFGSGGGLDKSIPPSKLIVPTHAYRDEGMSYHYAPASDYIEIKNSNVVAKILMDLGIDFVQGRTWTTDAFYRETRRNMEARKSEGCIIVEMEVSACQAVCDFRGYEFYPFLYRADNLDSTNWDQSILSLITIDERLNHLFIALELAKRIEKRD